MPTRQPDIHHLSKNGEPYHDIQYKTLKSEGVKFRRDKTVDLEHFQWDPERDGVPMDIRDLPLVF